MKYLPYILALATFLIGLSLGGNKQAEKELIKKLESDRETLFQVIELKERQIIMLEQTAVEIEFYRKKDSVKFAADLEANKQAYDALKKKYHEINLRRANSSTLDSIVSRLYAD